LPKIRKGFNLPINRIPLTASGFGSFYGLSGKELAFSTRASLVARFFR
jgi:hypothetical protein